MSHVRRLVRPKIFGVSLRALIDLYRLRLREHKAQELLAGLGIAVGVALFFGVLVANSSLIGSVGQILHAVTGKASLELVARSSDGIEQQLAERASKLPGVKVAAPLLRENAVLVGPRGRESIQLVGASPSQPLLQGAATRNLGVGALVLVADGLGLPSSVASATGAQPSGLVTILTAGSAHVVKVRAVLGSQEVGALANSPLVVTLLPMAQKITGLSHRVNQVLIEPEPGQLRLVEAELRKLAAGRMDVEPANHELSALRATAQPTSQSTTLFAAIGAMVGFLLALNAMLLTVPDRRLLAAELGEQGFGPRQVMTILISQAVMLGIAAALIGVVFGDLLSRTLFQQIPSYLTLAFPMGTRPVIPATTVILALGCGVLATVLASMLPLADLRRGRTSDAVLHEEGEPGQRISKRRVLTSGLAGLLMVLAVTVLVLLVPSLSVFGGVVLALATFCLVPSMFVLVTGGLRRAAESLRGSMLALAIIELRATATRSIALAGVAAIAVFGIVAIQGARRDLVTGLDTAVVQYLNTADVWVTTDNNFLTINSFPTQGATKAIAHAPGISSVREYQGQLLDVGSRRLWIRARPSRDQNMIQASQLIDGNLSHATSLIRHGGWAAVSDGFAKERHLHVGGTFTLPTPTGLRRFGVAAITTNVGWPPGAITLNDADYRADWQSTEPTALEINLKPGITPTAGKLIVERALRHRKGLVVETFNERKALYEQSARQGIQSLSDISTLLLIAASLAIAAALSAAIWQRRRRLASLNIEGFDSRQLWRSLLLESTILVTIGCLDGAILGIYGHALASRWLKLVVGFPAPFSLGAGAVILTLVVIICVALAVIAIPSLIATRAPTPAISQE
jgi:putative ABC transport system permease protein